MDKRLLKIIAAFAAVIVIAGISFGVSLTSEAQAAVSLRDMPSRWIGSADRGSPFGRYVQIKFRQTIKRGADRLRAFCIFSQVLPLYSTDFNDSTIGIFRSFLNITALTIKPNTIVITTAKI